MQGHHALIDMRRCSRHPKWVFVNDYPCKTDWHEWGEHATICIDGDSIASLDLRFLVGLNVSVSGTVLSRVKAVFELAKASGANRVADCQLQTGVHPDDQSGWTEVWQKVSVVEKDLEVCRG